MLRKLKAKGVREGHVVKEKETALDLALKASEKVSRNYERDKIDLIRLCAQSPECYLPSGSWILQKKPGLKTSIGALDYNRGMIWL